jgi:hypothetical protein
MTFYDPAVLEGRSFNRLSQANPNLPGNGSQRKIRVFHRHASRIMFTAICAQAKEALDTSSWFQELTTAITGSLRNPRWDPGSVVVQARAASRRAYH